MAVNYLLSSREAEKSADALQEKLNGKILKNMYASDNREEFAQKRFLKSCFPEIRPWNILAISTVDKTATVTPAVITLDDAEEMVSIIQKQFEILAVNYLLSSREAEKSSHHFSHHLYGGFRTVDQSAV